MSLDSPAQPVTHSVALPLSVDRGEDARDAADLLRALNALCAGDFAVRLEPRDGPMATGWSSGSTPSPS